MKLLSFESYIAENYFKGLSKSTIEKKKAQMKKQAEMEDDDPSAYKEMPGDEKGKKMLKKSKHTEKYEEMFEDETINEQSTSRAAIANPKIEKALKSKSEKTGIPIGILRAVMRRGMAAWKSGHRPGAGQEQWGLARVNSFVTKGKGTWGGRDADLAREVKKKKKPKS